MDINANSPFSRAFDYASDQTGRRFQNPLYFITEFFTGSKFRSSLAEVKKFGQQIVSNAQQRRQTRAQKDASNPTFGSLIDSLLDAFPKSPTITADAALNFLSAGRDTTAQSLTWTFYSLMRHPSALADLRQEINSTAVPFQPQDHDSTSSTTNPSYPLLKLSVADLQPTNLPTTMSIFNEALRLHPPVPFEIKQCQLNTTLPDGTFLPAGSIIIWCIWAMNRAREIWGRDDGHDPDEFWPERWLIKSDSGGGNVKLLTKSAFEFPVFNAGARSCLGKKMAELMACWVLVQVGREFEFEEVHQPENRTDSAAEGMLGKEERRSKNSLTLPMEGGLPCRVRLVRSY